jgi:hypothetical protein
MLVPHEAADHAFDLLVEEEAGLALKRKSFLLHGVLDYCEFVAVVHDGLLVIEDGYEFGGVRIEDGLLPVVFTEGTEEGLDEGGGVGGSGKGEGTCRGQLVPLPPDHLLLAQLLLLFDLPLHIYYRHQYSPEMAVSSRKYCGWFGRGLIL